MHPLPEHQLAEDECRLDRFAKADVIRDEQVHAWQSKRLAKRLELVGHHFDAGAERCLKQRRVSGGDRVPADGVQIGREKPRLVESAFADACPTGVGDDLGVDLALPQDFS